MKNYQQFDLTQPRLLRLKQIIGDPNADPPIPPIVPVSKSTWWEGVRTGRFPKPVKTLGERITSWRSEDIGELIQRKHETGRNIQ
jgi:prophage regulatory protein